ncbi:MAG: flagellar FliJ protein [Lentisphaeria bacterium]|jgi:flagellar FliJ protein
MERSKRLSLVLELAKRAEEEAARLFASSKNQLQQQESKLNELEQYYQDYTLLFSARNQALRAIEVARSRQLLQQLSNVKKDQQIHIAKALANMEAHKRVWQQAHLKHQNMKALIQRYRMEENQLVDKKEQKIIDEWVTQRRS